MVVPRCPAYEDAGNGHSSGGLVRAGKMDFTPVKIVTIVVQSIAQEAMSGCRHHGQLRISLAGARAYRTG